MSWLALLTESDQKRNIFDLALTLHSVVYTGSRGFFQFGEFTNFSLWLIIFFAFFLQYFGGAILNDLSDMSADKINMPYRPLESGIIKLNQAKSLVILITTTTIVLYITKGLFFASEILMIFLGLSALIKTKINGTDFKEKKNGDAD